MKKISLRFSLLSFAAIATTALIVTAVHGFKVAGNVATPDPGYSIVLDDLNAPFSLDENYARESDTETVFESGDYTLKMKYRLAKYEGSGHVTLAPHGLMFNEVDGSTHKNKITSLASIKVTYTSSASISVRTSIRNDGREFGAPRTVASNTLVEFEDNPYYFILEAGDAAAQIESVVLNYSCEAQTGFNLNNLTGTYTGKGTDNIIYKMTLDGSNVSLQSLDKVDNVSDSGTVSLLGGTTLNCEFTGGGFYMFSISEDQRVFTFASKGGAANSKFPEMNLYKVYKVEDFERFGATGNAFGGQGRDASSLYTMSGLRADWHSDWYTTSSSYYVSLVGDNGWRTMGSTDFLTYTATGGHGGSKAAAFKGNSNGLRYMSMKSMLGNPSIIGKGAYLSFWAKAYSNSALTTPKATDTAIKVYGLASSKVTVSNLNEVRTSVDVTIKASEEWARYEVPISDSKNYYGFGFYINSSATVYMVVDDVEIYTANPYAENIPVTNLSIAPTELDLEVGQHSTLTPTFTPANATNKGIDWTTDDDTVATVSNGTVNAVGAGTATITATSQDGGFTATCDVTVTVPSLAPYPEGSYIGTATVLGANYSIVIAFGNRSNSLVAVRLANKDAVATGVTYNNDTQAFTIATTGNYEGYTYGDITGTYDEVNDKLVNITCGGTISAGVSNNGSIEATKLDVYDCDGDTAALQAQFKRRYGDPWSVDTGNANRITSNTTEFVSGTGSLTLKGWTGGRIALNFQNDFSPAKQVQNVQYWVYNPSENDITLRMWYYEAASLGSNGETGNVVAKAGQWTYVAMGFGKEVDDTYINRTIYNFQIADFTSSGVFLSFDNIALF